MGAALVICPNGSGAVTRRQLQDCEPAEMVAGGTKAFGCVIKRPRKST